MIKLTMQEFIKAKLKQEVTIIIVISVLFSITGGIFGFQLAGDKMVDLKIYTCSEESIVEGGLVSYCNGAEYTTESIPLSYYLSLAGIVSGLIVFGIGILYIYSNVSFKSGYIELENLSFRYINAYKRYEYKNSIKL